MQEKGIIQSMKVIHKTPTSFLGDKGWVPLPTRWVIWAELDFERVWLRTVIDDGEGEDKDEEEIKLRLRSLIVRELFSDLIGREIEYARQYDHSMEPCYEVQESSLPETYLLDRFSDIKSWFDKNRPEYLANDCEVLRKKATQRRKATQEENKRIQEEQEKEKIVEMEAMIAQSPDLYFMAAFQAGTNPKNSQRQWECRRSGKLYVLDRLDPYSPSQGEIFVVVKRELVPGKIFLVHRMHYSFGRWY